MVGSRTSETEETSIALSNLLLHVPDVVISTMFIVIGSVFLFRFYLKRQAVAHQLTVLLKIPFIQRYFRLTLTRQFAAI